jgi:hypothetical protein
MDFFLESNIFFFCFLWRDFSGGIDILWMI